MAVNILNFAQSFREISIIPRVGCQNGRMLGEQFLCSNGESKELKPRIQDPYW